MAARRSSVAHRRRLTTRTTSVARSAAVALATVAAIAAAAALAGCSQVSALAPVGGGHLSEVRYAAIDILLDAGVEVLTAPVCTDTEDGAVMCTGETVDSRVILIESPSTDQSALTVTVADELLYSGSIMDVLDKAARSGS